MTSGEFDQWIAEKRQRPTGICNECGGEKELRQRSPEPLCGACYMKIDRQEKKEADPLAAQKRDRKRDNKIRSEMNKVLNVVYALDGLVADEHLNELSRIAKLHLRPIIYASDETGHGCVQDGSDPEPRTTAVIGEEQINVLPSASDNGAKTSGRKSKLTAEQELSLLRDSASGDYAKKHLALKYKIAYSTVCKLLRSRSRRAIPH